MKVYIIDSLVTSDRLTKRVSLYHSRVFHGLLKYECESRDVHYWPAFLTNDHREIPHATRSGRFVPPVFSRSGREYVVSSAVKKKCDVFNNLDFLKVEFEHLVDLEMPATGDFTWLDRPYKKGENFTTRLDGIFKAMDDVKIFHEKVGSYYALVVAEASALKDKYKSATALTPRWSAYAAPSCEDVHLSRQMMEDYPIVWDHALCLREDAFEVLAPHLDLDYFAISIVTLKD